MKGLIYTLFIITIFISCQSDTSKKTETIKENKTETADEVLTGYNKALSENQNDTKSLESRGDFYFVRGNFAQAAQDYNRLTKIDTSYAIGYHKLADAVLNGMDTRTALITMQSAAARFPNDIPTIMKLAKYELILQRFTDCKKTLGGLKKKAPQNAEVFLLIGKLGEETGDIKLAKSGYRKATELDASLMDAWKKIGDIYALEQNKIALKFYNNGLEVEPNNISLLLGKGTYFFKSNEPQKAIDAFKKVVINEPSNTLALYNIGLSYIALNDMEKAEENLNICLKTKPDHAPSYYFLGQIAEARKDKPTAKKMYEQSLVFNSKYMRAQEALDNL